MIYFFILSLFSLECVTDWGQPLISPCSCFFEILSRYVLMKFNMFWANKHRICESFAHFLLLRSIVIFVESPPQEAPEKHWIPQVCHSCSKSIMLISILFYNIDFFVVFPWFSLHFRDFRDFRDFNVQFLNNKFQIKSIIRALLHSYYNI